MTQQRTIKYDGGMAFPLPCDPSYGDPQEGMSLVDYFAAKALPVILADIDQRGTIDDVAGEAYDVADAMLRERKSRYNLGWDPSRRSAPALVTEPPILLHVAEEQK